MAPPLALEQRKLIVLLREAGHTIRDIERRTGISRKTIYVWLRRNEETGGDLTARHRQLYPRATSAEQDAAIVAAHTNQPHLNTRVTAIQYCVSTQTIRRRLRALAEKEAHAGDRKTLKREREAIQNSPVAGTSSKSYEPANLIEPTNTAIIKYKASSLDLKTIKTQPIESTSNVSSEDETSNPDLKTINTQAIRHKSYVSSEHKTRNPDVKTSDTQANKLIGNVSSKDKISNPDLNTINTQAIEPSHVNLNVKTNSPDVKNIKTQPIVPTSNVHLKDKMSNPHFKTIKTQPLESTSNVSSEDEMSDPNVETIDTQALKVTLARIRANPQLYIGVPKNCYHLIEIIHEHTDILTMHILLCLKKIKLDTHFEELADQFGITADEASQIFKSNVPALANVLQSFVDNQDSQIPLRSENSSCVIDSLEIKVQPFSDNSGELTQTKRGNTVKYVVCCTPDGYINYVSPGYGGRQSDERLLEDTKYLDRLNSGDSVVTNGLWNVESMLLQKGLKVVKPRARQKDCAKFCATQDSTTNETQPSEDQVKRLVQRIREFTMVKDHYSLSCELVRVLDEAVVISCALINLQSFVIN